jgi:hypothetical protein
VSVELSFPVKFTFTIPQATAPFQYGDTIVTTNIVAGGADPAFYNDSWTVYSCTANDVTVVTDLVYTWPAYVSGGNLGRDFMNYEFDTDCNARVTVKGPTDQVFVSAQLDLAWQYNCTNPIDYNVVVRIRRGKGFPSDTPGSTDYLFKDFVTVSEKTFVKTVTAGTGTQELEAIFTTVLDGTNLDFGYYWYILTVEFVAAKTDITIGRATTTLRSLTSQVIKQ